MRRIFDFICTGSDIKFDELYIEELTFDCDRDRVGFSLVFNLLFACSNPWVNRFTVEAVAQTETSFSKPFTSLKKCIHDEIYQNEGKATGLLKPKCNEKNYPPP